MPRGDGELCLQQQNYPPLIKSRDDAAATLISSGMSVQNVLGGEPSPVN